MTLYLPIGPPGCGKSTLASALVDAGVLTRDAVVSPDDYRTVLTGARADQSANRTVFTVVDIVVAERMKRNLDVWLDATNLSLGPLEAMMRQANAFGQEIVCVLCHVDTVELRRRNLTRTDPVPFDVLENMVARETAAHIFAHAMVDDRALSVPVTVMTDVDMWSKVKVS